MTMAAAHIPAYRRASIFRPQEPREPRHGSTTLCHVTTEHSQLKSRTFHRMCLPLVAKGFTVTYLSPASLTPDVEHIEFVQLPGRRKFAMLASGKLDLLRTLGNHPADVYHFQDPQLLGLGLILKLCFGKRVIYDAYEDFPSMAAGKASVPSLLRPIFAKLVGLAESMAARSFDAIFTADPFTLRRLARIGRSRKLVFYNFPNLDFFPAPEEKPKAFDVVYRGGLSERAGTFVLLDAVQRLALAGRPVRLLLAGYCDNPTAEHHLRTQINAMGLASNVEICGRIPHEEMASLLAKARIGVSPLQDTPKFRLNIPVKLFEYWACGLPVVASDLPPSRTFVRNSGAGLLFPPGNVAALARNITTLLNNPETALQMGRRGRALVEQRFNNAVEIRKLLLLLNTIAANAIAPPEREAQHA